MSIDVKDLLEAGVHFGHQTKRWNPRMKPFIFDARNGIHIIDLTHTVRQLDEACKFMRKQVRDGGEILFVGTKKQAQSAVRETAQETRQLYITQRWLGGALTNFNTVKKSIGRLEKIEKMESDGSINNFGKKEQASLKREAARLSKNLDGMRRMQKYPAAMFIVDIKRERNALAEARRLKIPIVAIVDTNSDPTTVDYPIAGNDDAIRSIRIILNVIKQALTEGRSEAAIQAASEPVPPAGEAKPEAASTTPGEASVQPPEAPVQPQEAPTDSGSATAPASSDESASKPEEPNPQPDKSDTQPVTPSGA